MQGAPEPGDLTYDPKPESPTISQQITASTGSSEPAPEYGFQIRLEKDTSGAVTGASIKPGAIYPQRLVPGNVSGRRRIPDRPG